jgi:hypothetical protein
MSDKAVAIASGAEGEFGLTIPNWLEIAKYESLECARKFLAMICEKQPQAKQSL